MAANDILVKLLLNTDQFDSRLVKSKTSVKDFERQFGYASAAIKSATATLGKLAVGVAAAKGAYEVFTRTMNSCESSADSLKRSQAALTSVTNNFFYALNTGSFDNFLSGLSSIIDKARDAYDAIDRLGTMKTFNTPAMKEAQAMIEAARAVLSDPNATKAEKSEAKQQMQRGQQELSKILTQQRDQAIESYYAVIDKAMGPANISRATADAYLKNFDSYESAVKRYEALRTLVQKGTTAGMTMTSSAGTYTTAPQYTKEAAAIKESNEYRMLQALVEKEGELAEAMKLRNEALDYDIQNAQTQRTVNRALKGADGATSSGSGVRTTKEEKAYTEETIAWFQQKVSEQQKILNESADEETRYLAQQIINNYTTAIEEIKKRANLGGSPDFAINALKNAKPGSPDYAKMVGLPTLDKIDEKNMQKPEEQGKKIEDQLKSTTSAANSLAQSFGRIGSAAAEMGNSTVANLAGMMGDISSMISEIAQLAVATGATSAAKMPFPANIAAITSVAATIMSVISKSKRFATGGIVGGSAFDGDTIPARLNSGEIVINQAQQRKLWDTISGETLGGGEGAIPHVSGELLYLPIRTFLKRTGKTW